jgi:hypothetical protein
MNKIAVSFACDQSFRKEYQNKLIVASVRKVAKRTSINAPAVIVSMATEDAITCRTARTAVTSGTVVSVAKFDQVNQLFF